MLDINDNTPTFHPDPNLYPGAYIVTIDEGPQSVGKAVIDVNATDNDLGNNSVITYSIGDDGGGYFMIDFLTGKVILKRPIDRENISLTNDVSGFVTVEFTVKAADNGKDQRTAVLKVSECPLDYSRFFQHTFTC